MATSKGLMRRLRQSTNPVLLAIALFFSYEGVALSDPSELLIREGVELRRQGQTAEALPKFQAAYDQSRSPRAAAQLGLCEFALDRWLSAEEHIRESLAARSDPWIRAKREQLEESLHSVRGHLARLDIEGTPPLAEVTIAKKFRGTLAASPFWIDPGTVTVTIEASGFRTLEQEIAIAKAESKVLKVALVSASVAAPASVLTVPAAAAPEAPALAARIGEAAPVPSDEPSPSGARWGWYALGGSLAVAAIATVFFLGGSSPSAADYEREVPSLR